MRDDDAIGALTENHPKLDTTNQKRAPRNRHLYATRPRLENYDGTGTRFEVRICPFPACYAQILRWVGCLPRGFPPSPGSPFAENSEISYWRQKNSCLKL